MKRPPSWSGGRAGRGPSGRGGRRPHGPVGAFGGLPPGLGGGGGKKAAGCPLSLPALPVLVFAVLIRRASLRIRLALATTTAVLGLLVVVGGAGRWQLEVAWTEGWVHALLLVLLLPVHLLVSLLSRPATPPPVGRTGSAPGSRRGTHRGRRPNSPARAAATVSTPG